MAPTRTRVVTADGWLSCNKCREIKPPDEFWVDRTEPQGRQRACKSCMRPLVRDWMSQRRANGLAADPDWWRKRERARRATDPRRYWLLAVCSQARNRAKKLGIPCDITPEYIHTITGDVCPVFGIPFNFDGKSHPKPNSPSIDRIVPSRGYTQGNVIVISYRANQIKRDATIEELQIIARFYQNLTARSQTDLRMPRLDTPSQVA